MNLGRFHAAVFELKKEFESNSLIQELSNMHGTLQQSVSAQTPESAAAFKNSYSKIMDLLLNAESNTTFPTRKNIYKEMGASKYVGSGLYQRLKNTISENQITPINASVEVKKIIDEVNVFYNQIKVLDDTFESLGVEYENLDPGEFEVGFSLPKNMVGNSIESLEKEFHKLDLFLKTMQEIVGDEAGSLKVKTISASEWQIFVDSIPAVAACISVTIERIVALYKTNLEIKALKNQLEEKNLPEEVTEPLKVYVENAVKQEIRKVAENLVDEYYQKDDEERKNELKNKTTQSLRYLADRIDKGAVIEVHAMLPKEPKGEVTGAEGDGEGDKTVAHAELEKYDELSAIVNMVNKSTLLTYEVGGANELTLSIGVDDEENSNYEERQPENLNPDTE